MKIQNKHEMLYRKQPLAGEIKVRLLHIAPPSRPNAVPDNHQHHHNDQAARTAYRNDDGIRGLRGPA